MNPNSTSEIDSRVQRAWTAALLLLVVFVMWRIGGFDLTNILDTGRSVPNTYGSVDHPFHAARAASLLDALKNGEILRWVGSYQGGYPVEFYPLGAAWVDVILWAGMFGSVSILAVHKLAVALIFVLSAIAYWLLVRGDRLHPSTAFLAMSFHIAVPGFWLNGGYEELVGWGLVTNVAGATLALIATVLLVRFVLYRQHSYGVWAVLSIAAAAVTNPRSLFGIVFASVAIAGWSILTSTDLLIRRRVADTIVLIGTVGVLALCIAALVIFSLMRYNGHYFFLHYMFYDPIRMFWDALVMALTVPLLLVVLVAAVLVFFVRSSWQMRVSQVVALTTILYSLFTVWVATIGSPPPLVEQLEASRLMPFQRFLMLALAAIVIVLALKYVTAKLDTVKREAIIAATVLTFGIGAISILTIVGTGGQANEKAMYSVSTVGDQRFADLEDVVMRANEIRPQGTAVFVVGNHHEWWHEQLWVPGIVDGTYYFDDWLWYWHRDQPGPYDRTQGYFMQNPTDALTEEYFIEHGIGVVMVSDMWVPSGTPPKQAAANSSLLEPVGSYGAWDVYAVNVPTSIASRDGFIPDEVSWFY